MLANFVLAAMLSHGSAAPDEDAATVAVLPIVVEGELPDIWQTKAGERLNTGLRRGTLGVSTVDATSCKQWDCAGTEARSAGADFGVWTKLTVASGGRDYALEIKAVGADTKNVVASLEGTCDLCGYEEAVAMVEAKAAAMSTALERLGGHPIVAFAGTPDGVAVLIDDEPVGTTPLEIPLAPGTHSAKLHKDGYLPQTFSVAAVEGIKKELTFALVEAPAQGDPAATADRGPGRGLVIAGGVLTGLGVAVVGGGGVLLALHDRPYSKNCMADMDGDCRKLYSTLTGGAIATAIGSSLVGSGVALLIVGIKRRRAVKGRDETRLRVAPGGLALAF